MSTTAHHSPRPKTRRVVNRTVTSCEPCHRRKVKCDRAQPCGQCVRYSLQHECRYSKRSTAVRPPLVPEAASPPRTTRADRPHAATQSRKPPSSALLHRWTGIEDVRGRSHHSWLVKKFEPLLSHLHLGICAAGPWPDTRAYSACASNVALRIESQQNHSEMAPVLYDELPDPQTTEWLIDRFFATLGTTFSILHAPTFWDGYARMRENGGGASVCFMVQLLLVLCLANATLPDTKQAIPRSKVVAWINLAEGLPQTAMHLRNFDVETVRMWALICLAEQMWHSDEFADYVYSGAALRAGAALGLHHPRLWESSDQRRGLWEALVELDLQACLAAGMPVSLSYFTSQPPVTADVSRSPSPSSERSTSQTLSADRAQDFELSGSLPCRYRIVQALNCTKDLTLESALELGRQLTASMLPPLEAESGSPATQSFQQQMAAHVYGKFLAALHRPFAMMDSPAFHYSRTVALSLAQKNAAEMFALYTGEADEASAFDCLRLGGGSFCKAQSIPAFLLLCWELRLSADRPDNTDPITSWIEPGLEMNGRSATIYSTVKKLLPFVKSHPQDQDMTTRAHLIGFLTIAHYEISGECENGSDEYLRRMRESASTFRYRYQTAVRQEEQD